LTWRYGNWDLTRTTLNRGKLAIRPLGLHGDGDITQIQCRGEIDCIRRLSAFTDIHNFWGFVCNRKPHCGKARAAIQDADLDATQRIFHRRQAVRGYNTQVDFLQRCGAVQYYPWHDDFRQ